MEQTKLQALISEAKVKGFARLYNNEIENLNDLFDQIKATMDHEDWTWGIADTWDGSLFLELSKLDDAE